MTSRRQRWSLTLRKPRRVAHPAQMRLLLAPDGFTTSSRHILLIECLPYQRLDHRLPADLQLLGCPVQFLEHSRRQINVHPLDWFHHPPRIGEEPGHIFALVGQTGRRLCRYWLSPSTSFVHRVAAPGSSVHRTGSACITVIPHWSTSR